MMESPLKQVEANQTFIEDWTMSVCYYGAFCLV